MPIAWSADGREFHLRNDLISYAVGVNPNGSLGHRYFGPALAADRTFGHVETPAFEGFANRVGDPVAARIPDDGFGRLPGAGLDRRAGRRFGRPRARLRRAPGPRRQARPSAGGRPAGDLRRVRRGGGDARDRPRRRAQRPRRRAVVHGLRRPARGGPEHADPQQRGGRRPADRRDERRRSTCRMRAGSSSSSAGHGPARTMSSRVRCARDGSRWAATAGPRARCTTRSSPCAAPRRPRPTAK